jgi:hypothetical protein
MVSGDLNVTSSKYQLRLGRMKMEKVESINRIC